MGKGLERGAAVDQEFYLRFDPAAQAGNAAHFDVKVGELLVRQPLIRVEPGQRFSDGRFAAADREDERAGPDEET